MNSLQVHAQAPRLLSIIRVIGLPSCTGSRTLRTRPTRVSCRSVSRHVLASISRLTFPRSLFQPVLLFLGSKCKTASVDATWTHRAYSLSLFLSFQDPSQPVQAWPEGFKMLAGDPNSKSPNRIFTYYCHRKPDLSDEISSDNFNFDDPCIGGIKFDLTFPSCWDGINLYKPDQSHMAYPTHGLRDGPCPASHPIRLPSILLEYTYHPENYPAITKGKNMRGNLAWANGDTTGYGLHADFMMGWDRDILTKALNDPGCVTLGYAITIQSCPTLAPYFNIGAAQNCRPARGQLQEPYPQGDGNIVPKLPGCNLLWASGPKPTCSPPVPGLDVSNFLATAGPDVLPASQQLNTTMPSGPGWHKLGCFNAALETTMTYTDPAMTPERCQDSCKKNGYTYAGLTIVGGFQCVCSNTFSKSAGITLSGCDTACPVGSSSCGGKLSGIFRYDAYPNLPYVRPISSGCLLSGGSIRWCRSENVRPWLLQVAVRLAIRQPRQGRYIHFHFVVHDS